MATLDALGELDYPSYEVLVIDNNTHDPSLWQPVQAHCERLGKRFRFFHVDVLPGAKAGALNFALRNTASDAELVGIVDSDYIMKPDFLASLVGYFDDPSMGFVQTSQGYRGWKQHSYLRMCNCEYTVYLVTNLVSRNDRMAAITLGTMGLIRRKLLDDIEGWAEWCVTEDSEIAPRIHSRGYKSMYVSSIFGRGLIPERFGDYKRQRFRWSYGAIQELRRHFRLYLPRPVAQDSRLNTRQKFAHLMHALDTLKSGLEFLILLFGAALVASMLLQHQSVQLPAYMWWVFAVAVILAFWLKALVFRSLGWSFRDTLDAAVAYAALDHTIAIASLSGLLTRNIRWQRTNKFRVVPSGLAALGAVIPELLFGGAIAVVSIEVLCAENPGGLVHLLVIGGLLKAGKYLLAPLLAILAEHGIRQRAVAAPRAPKA